MHDIDTEVPLGAFVLFFSARLAYYLDIHTTHLQIEILLKMVVYS